MNTLYLCCFTTSQLTEIWTEYWKLFQTHTQRVCIRAWFTLFCSANSLPGSPLPNHPPQYFLCVFLLFTCPLPSRQCLTLSPSPAWLPALDAYEPSKRSAISTFLWNMLNSRVQNTRFKMKKSIFRFPEHRNEIQLSQFQKRKPIRQSLRISKCGY